MRKSHCSHRNVPHLASLLHHLSRQNVSLMSGDNGFNAGLLPRSDLQNGYQPDASDNGNGTAAEHNLNGNSSRMRHRETAQAGNGTTGLDCVHPPATPVGDCCVDSFRDAAAVRHAARHKMPIARCMLDLNWHATSLPAC